MDRSDQRERMDMATVATVFVVNLVFLAATMEPVTNNFFGRLLFLGNLAVFGIAGAIMCMHVAKLVLGKYSALREAQVDELLAPLEEQIRDSTVGDDAILNQVISLLVDFPIDHRRSERVCKCVSDHRPHLLDKILAHFS